MAPLTKDGQRHTKAVPHRLAAVPVAAGAVIYTAAGVCADAAGLAVPASDTAGLISVGMARYGFDNATGSDGVVGAHSERYVEVDTAMIASYAVSAGTPGAGRLAYWVDDNTISADPTVNNVVAGRFVEPDDIRAGHWYVDHLRA